MFQAPEEADGKSVMAKAGLREVYRVGGEGKDMKSKEEKELEEHVAVVEEALAGERKAYTASFALETLCTTGHPRAEEFCLRLFESEDGELRMIGAHNLGYLREPVEHIVTVTNTPSPLTEGGII